MSLPAFDTERHAIGLGPLAPDGGHGEHIGFTISGAYRKTFKRDQAGDQNGVHYGSDSYFNDPGVSSWTMDDFTGGQFQRVWGRDNRMFNHSDNMIPMDFDRSLRTVPPMRMSAATGDGGGLYTTKPLCFYNNNGWVSAFYRDRIYAHDSHPGGGANEAFVATIGGAQYSCGAYDRSRNRVVGCFKQGGHIGVAALDPFSGALIIATQPFIAGLDATGGATGINIDGDKMVLAFDNLLYTVVLQDGVNYFGGGWTRIGRLPGSYIDSCWSGGLLYILVGGSDKKVQLLAFDGVQALPVCDFPYNFHGYCVQSYGGRIYVGGAGLDYNGSASYGELYEVTGSSTRLLKTFAPEKKSYGQYAYTDAIFSMVVHEGMLHFGMTGWGLCVYDVTTDAFYGGPMMDYGRVNPGRQVLSLISARGRVWAYVSHPAGTGDNAIWNTCIAGDQYPLAANPGVFVSSDFGPELDRLKDWDKVRLLTRGDSDSPSLSTSTDGGVTYTAATLLSSESCGRAGTLRTYQVNSANSHALTIAVWLWRNSSPTAGYTELAGLSTSFKLIDTDNINANGTEKLAWSFTVAGVEDVEMQDGTSENQRLEEIRDQLWSWAQAKTPLSFWDADGTLHYVKIDSITESQPVVLPPVPYDDPSSSATQEGREAFYSLVLIET